MGADRIAGLIEPAVLVRGSHHLVIAFPPRRIVGRPGQAGNDIDPDERVFVVNERHAVDQRWARGQRRSQHDLELSKSSGSRSRKPPAAEYSTITRRLPSD